MWKKAFIILLSINLLILTAFTMWFGSLSRVSKNSLPPAPVAGSTAPVQVSIGQSAINAYLEYALSEQPDLKKFLSYAKVTFGTTWEIELGVKLSDRVVPFDINFAPTVVAGNLDLRVVDATMGQIPLPPAGLILVFKHLPMPAWIHVDAPNETLDVNLTERPQNPYGVRILSYNMATKMLTLLVTIVPKSVLKH